MGAGVAGAAVGAVTVTLARSDEQFEAAFPVIVQLRPHLAALEFVMLESTPKTYLILNLK